MRTETAVATGPPYLFKKAHPTIHATQYTLYYTGASNIWQLWTIGLSTFTERRQVCVWPCAAVTLTRPQAVPAAPCLSRGRCSVLGGPPALRPEHRGLVIVGGGGGGGGGATVRSAWSYKSTPSTDSTDRSLDRQHDSACSTRARMGNDFSSAEWPTGSTRAQSGIENKCTRAVCHIPGTIFITLLLVLCKCERRPF